MKTSLTLSVCLGLILFSCSTTPEEPLIDEPLTETDSTNTESLRYVEDCTDSPYKLFHEAVVIWQQTWSDKFSSDPTAAPVSYLFSKANLDSLHNLFPEAEGARMYYGLKSSEDSIPVLCLVNMQSCLDLGVNEPDLACVLLSDATGQKFITADEACVMTANWRTFSEEALLSHTPVNAYNYSWKELDDLSGAVEGEPVNVRYGLRTLSPGDTAFYQSQNEAYGSVVYVNVMTAGVFENSVEAFFDFAMPCPQKCDFTSKLVVGCAEE